MIEDQDDIGTPPPIENTVPRVVVVPSPVVIRPNLRGDVDERQAALYLSCSTRKMRKMRRADEGPNWRMIAGRVWYPLAALDEYLEACKHVTSR